MECSNPSVECDSRKEIAVLFSSLWYIVYSDHHWIVEVTADVDKSHFCGLVWGKILIKLGSRENRRKIRDSEYRNLYAYYLHIYINYNATLTWLFISKTVENVSKYFKFSKTNPPGIGLKINDASHLMKILI